MRKINAQLVLALFAVAIPLGAQADILCVKTVAVPKRNKPTEYHVVSVTLSGSASCPAGSKPVRDRNGAIAQFANPVDVKNISLNTFLDNLESLNSSNVGPQGPIGPQGPAGATGPAGSVGARGDMGPAGPAGPAGAPGAIGPQGPAGPAGATGASGPQGPAGLAGATGAVGPQGPAGAPGAIGPQGPAGPAGPTGARGFTGPAGPAGAPGLIGPQGPQGPTGATGAIGPQGPAGPAGTTGPQGPAGPTGPMGPAGTTVSLNQRWGVDYFDWWDIGLSSNPYPSFTPSSLTNCSASGTFPGSGGVSLGALSQSPLVAGQKLVPGGVYSLTVWGVISSSGNLEGSYESWVAVSDWQGGSSPTNFLWKRGGARGSNYPDGTAPYSTTVFVRANPNGDVFLRQPCGTGEIRGLSYFRIG